MSFSNIALTIAGSDSGGAAGIQADLKTFAFHCVHGTSVITCLTAQNTLGVNQVQKINSDMINAQIEAIMSDINVQAVKTGMLFSEAIILAVSQQLKQWKLQQVVVDPVMVSRTGVKLIDDQAIACLKNNLIPLSLIVTPNRYEAQILSNLSINSLENMKQAAEIIYNLGSKFVLVKGGGMKDDLQGVDVWFDGQNWEVLTTESIKTPHTHGTGCTLSAAITANLALGKEPLMAVKQGKEYVTTALKYGLEIGKGTGPVGHFFPLLQS
ncbi:bifunctional hydroxymethylpyrimidine kinase/phosphomethylpyrimidine kinase [Crocosphaera sp.]|uniref:bifunctional hydroxymethylpyrimidine kinase/phosphomethylpyrimidine kinase n=1 Tax=Crocosphaera sp. TaxID=2729996 RepID=UPI003F220F63|nr:bifunctional hydroxymethylpyrimidine kinase/phosphomethylpyrimidine kinase [Crocosphaera sp.]